MAGQPLGGGSNKENQGAVTEGWGLGPGEPLTLNPAP